MYGGIYMYPADAAKVVVVVVLVFFYYYDYYCCYLFIFWIIIIKGNGKLRILYEGITIVIIAVINYYSKRKTITKITK